MYNIAPKPTLYNGRLYRSRLEAKWQCMFDLLGWQAEYEPCQINGWNPDFIIKCNSYHYKTNSIIVEVKPSMMVDPKLINDTLLKYETCHAHILILTDFPFVAEFMDDMIPIGIGSQFYEVNSNIESSEPPRSDMHELYMKTDNDFSSQNLWWDGMVYGKIERKQFITPRDLEYKKLITLWADCGNKTQFKVNG